MTTITRPRKPVKVSRTPYKASKPVHGSCWWAVQPTDSHPGVLVINSTAYLVNATFCAISGDPLGYQLRKTDGTVYDLAADLSSCDCPDATYQEERPGGCKHRRALAAALKAIG
jgi:hypothetical protein